MANKLRPCKACGQPIAKNAKACPHCGAKNKKKHPILAIILVLAIIVIAVNVADRDRPSKIEPSSVTLQQETQPAESAPATDPAPTSTEDTGEVTSEATEPPTTDPTEETAGPELVDGMRPEFKAAMDSYEAFYVEYCDFMKKYNADPTDLTLLGEYADILAKAAQMDADLAKWDQTEMNAAELKYYTEVTGRVAQMLLQITQ